MIHLPVAYGLTGAKIDEEQAVMGAFNFAVVNSLGAFLVLLGIGLLYGRTGALNAAQIGVALKSLDPLSIVALALLTSGFFVKAAVVPFHFWLADAHAVAPSPVCVLFSGVMVELGLYGAFRVWTVVFGPHLDVLRPALGEVIVPLGCVTALVGGVMAYATATSSACSRSRPSATAGCSWWARC